MSHKIVYGFLFLGAGAGAGIATAGLLVNAKNGHETTDAVYEKTADDKQ